MPTSDPWAKYPEQTQGTVAAPQDDPWAKYPEVSQEPSFLNKVKDQIVSSGAAAVNPLGTGLDMLNQIPGVQDVIPDFLAGPGVVATGVAKGGYNAARNTLQLGADIQDYVIPGDATPVSDALKAVPEAKYDGMVETGVGNITEIASGFLLGNKMGALARTEKLGADAVAIAEKIAPEATHNLIKFAASIIKGGAQGVVGTTVTTKPGSTNLVTGKNALVTHLGIGPLLEGLPTDSKDAAQNALAARVNTVIDGFITGAGLTTAFKGIGALSKLTIGPMVYDKFSPLWSQYAALKTVFDQIGEDFKKIPGVDTPKGLDAIHKRAAELAGNLEAGTLSKDVGKELGMAGVEPIHEALDTATTVGRQAKASGDATDTAIANALEARAKEIGQQGYEKTAMRREAPARALENTLSQTEDVLGGAKTADAGMKDIQDIGNAQVQQGKTEQKLAQTEITNTTDNITQHVSREREVTGKQVNELFDAVPADAKYDSKSLTKIMTEEKDTISPEVKAMLTDKANDGSFKYLNKTVKTRVNSMITKLLKLDVRTHAQQLELASLTRVQKNLAEDQIKHLQDIGRTDVIDAAKTAQDAWESRIASNRQGVVGDLQKIEDANPFKLDNIKAKSHDALVKEIGNLEHPGHEKRLRELLETDEGGRSQALIDQYKNAKDKVAELDNIEKQVYGDKLREFYDQHNFTPNGDAVEAFEKFLGDPQKNNRLKEILSDAETAGKPGVNKALKYAYARSLKQRLYSGHQTELGNPTTNAPGVQGLLNDESFMRAGDAIFKDSPEFMNAARDTLEIANDIQKAAYKRGAPKGTASMIVERAKQGLKTASALSGMGPLSHKGFVIKNIFSGFLEVLGPQGAVHRLADTLLENGTAYSEAYAVLKNTKDQTGKRATTAIKVLVNSVLRTNGERKQFDKKFKELKITAQTDEVLGKNKTAGPSGKFEGQLEEGNIDLSKRPKVKMDDGSYGTVYSESREEDGKEVLYPRIVGGKLLTSKEAWKHYKDTGENLGKFDTPEHADVYAEKLHQAQEEYYK